ncbi:ImmA/IrrE family metallo-endopeptidase, partial [Xanthomonas hortorum]|uniref:ImmA/IrrE family metallo-endopeptidase n=1 Tax=Xanthomonas hortorum TaxID=56454 RepID=UPI002042F409
MDSYRRQQIEAKAQDMLNDAGVLALPINPMKIAAHLDIQVHAKPADSSGASGWLVRQGNDFAIIYATHIESPGFQNFSVAHELGHYCLCLLIHI